MENNLPLTKGDLLVRCTKCNSSSTISAWRENNGCGLSIVRTAQEIAHTLDIPFRMVHKDSVIKGLKSGSYVDL